MLWINDKFKIIEEKREYLSGFKEYLAEDKEGKLLRVLYIDFNDQKYRKDFLNLMFGLVRKTSTISIPNITHTVGIYPVREVDGEISYDRAFVYVTEYLEKIPIKESLPTMVEEDSIDLSPVLDVMISLFNTLTYYEYMGIHWSFFSHENIFFREYEGEKILCLEAPIFAYLNMQEERNLLSSSFDDEIFTNMQLSYKNEYDFFSISKILLDYLNLGESKADLASEWNSIKKILKEKNGFDNLENYALTQILDRLINTRLTRKPFIYRDLVEDLNKNYLTDYETIKIDDCENMKCFHVGELTSVKKNEFQKIEELIRTKDKNFAVFIKGDRDKQSKSYMTDLENEFFIRGYFSIYFGNNESEKTERGLIRILNSLPNEPTSLNEFGGKTIFLETLLPYIQSPFPGLSDDLDPFYCKLIMIAAQFIEANLPGRETVLIVDYISRLSDHMFYLLLNLFMITKNKKLIVIIELDENTFRKREVLRVMHSYFKEEENLLEFTPKAPSKLEIEKTLKDLFNNPHLSDEFISLIWEATEGSPRLIRKMMVSLREISLFKFNEKKYTVEIDGAIEYDDIIDSYNKNKEKQEILSDKFNELNEEEKEFLKKYSVFINDYPVEDIADILSYDLEYLKGLLSNLVDKEFLEIEISYPGLYSFQDNLLKQRIYDSLDLKEKDELHKLILEKIPNMDSVDIFWHQKELGVGKYNPNAAKVIKSLVKQEYANKNLEKTIEYLEELSNYNLPLNEHFSNQIKLLNLYENVRGLRDASEKAEEIYESITDGISDENLDLYCGNVLLYAPYARDEVKKYADERIKKRRFEDSKIAKVFYNINQGRIEIVQGDYEGAEKSFREAILQCGEDPRFLDLRGASKRNLGTVKYYEGNTEEAIKMIEDAILDQQTAGDLSGVIKCRVNLGVCFAYNSSTRKNSILQYEEALRVARQYNLSTQESVLLANLSSQQDILYADYTMSLKYAREAYELLVTGQNDEVNVHVISTLIKAEMSTGNFRSAYEDFIRNMDYDEISQNFSLWSDFYSVGLSLVFELRNFERLRSMMERMKDFVTIERYSFVALEMKLFESVLGFVLDGEGDILGDIIAMVEYLEEHIEERSHNYRYVKITKTIEAITVFLYSYGSFDNFSEYLNRVRNFSKKVWEEIYEVDAVGSYGTLIKVLDEGLTFRNVEEVSRYSQKTYTHSAFIILSTMIAEYSAEQGRFWEGISWIYEAMNILITLLRNIPFEDRVNYVKYNNLAKLIATLDAFLNKQDPFNVKYEREVASETIEELIYEFDLYKTAIDRNIISNLYDEHVKNEENYMVSEATMSFGDDDRENLGVMLGFLAHRLMTKNAFLCLFNAGNYELASKTRFADEELFKQIAMHLDLTKFHVTKSGEFGRPDVQSIMVVPIYPNVGFDGEEGTNTVASAIFVADRLLHLVSYEGFEKIKGFGNLFSILLENDKLNREENTDSLTGAMSRRALELNIVENIKSIGASKSPFTILMYDLDRFKSVNDIFGHLAGDKVLKVLSQETMRLLPEGASFGRYGGEEFIITLPETDKEEGYHFAEFLRKHLRQITFEELNGGSVSVSIGVAETRDERERYESLVLKADEALYQAKEGGRDMSVIWQKVIMEDKVRYDRANRKFLTKMQDSLYRLAFIEILQSVDDGEPPEVKLYMMLNRIMELLQSKESRLALFVDEKVVEVYTLVRGERMLHIDQDTDREWLRKFDERREGFYVSNWVDEEKEMGIRNRNSAIILPVEERGKIKGALFLMADMKEKEFEAEDFAVMRVFSVFFVNVLKEMELIYVS